MSDEEDINKLFEVMGETQRKIRLPGEGEVLGIVIQMLGYDRARVRCTDGKVRLCRIPGKMKKRIWIREGDAVLIAPWDFQDDRGDIICLQICYNYHYLRFYNSSCSGPCIDH